MRKSFILEVHNRFQAFMDLDEEEDSRDEETNRNWGNIVIAYLVRVAKRAWAIGSGSPRSGCHQLHVPGKPLKAEGH